MKIQRAIRSWIMLVAFCAALSSYAADLNQLNQVHLNVTDSAKFSEWYAKYMGAKVAKMGTREIVSFGKVNILNYQKEAPIAGSAGSVVDHIGISFSDLDAKMKEFQEAGIKIVMPPRAIGKLKVGFIEDPWGTKIEVMQDPDLIGFHHVHVAATNPDEIIKWFADAFGGEQMKFMGTMPAVKYGDIVVLAMKASAEPAPTIGRAIDHIGFGVANMDDLAKHLKDMGAKFTTEPRALGNGKVAFIEGPSGLRIELIQSGPQQQ